jgi:hypothetical protein
VVFVAADEFFDVRGCALVGAKHLAKASSLAAVAASATLGWGIAATFPSTPSNSSVRLLMVGLLTHQSNPDRGGVNRIA